MDEGAAFGFFPQLRPRRRLQDPIASADVPLQVLRGRLAGLLGAPADILNIVRSPMPMEMFGDYQYEQPKQLPYTTEYFLKELPLAPTAPVGQLAGQAASFVPLNPAPLVRGAQKLGTMVGEGMAERVATGRPMLPSLLAEPQSAMFAVEPNVPRMNLLDTPPETMTSLLEVKPQAPVSDLGFYSAAEQAALNLQRNKGSGQAFLNDLLKAENVKKDELQWMGLDDFLKEKPNVTKQEVQDFIANNRVDVQEVTLGGKSSRDIAQDNMDAFTESVRQRIGKSSFTFDDMTDKEMLKYDILNERLLRAENDITPSKFGRYTLPGGENYREILLTLPQKPQPLPEGFNVDAYSVNGVTKYGVYDASGQRYGSGATKDEALQRFSEMHQDKPYKSSHFDEPNILAHIRVNDRVDADGKKMLLIEEIQSDWHQAGREKGYMSANKQDRMATTAKPMNGYFEVSDQNGNFIANVMNHDLTNPTAQSALAEAQRRIQSPQIGRQANDERVPDAPFKDTWYQLALKRALKYAADNGYERVGLTTGKQQAERFDLSKQISKVYYSPPDSKQANKFGTVLKAFDKRGNEIINKSVTPEQLPDYIGKEAANKLLESNGNSMGVKSLDGIDLQVGGEGMKKYYDEIYPKFLDKYGKKWNAKVGETQITTDYARDANGIPAQRPSKESIRYIDITPEMKGAVSKGQPLFAAAPALPLGAQGLLGEPEKKKELSLLD